MKTKKLKSIKSFTKNEIQISKLNGGYDGIEPTPGGTLSGMRYTEDWFEDNDNNGQWGIGETLTIVWSLQASNG